jgi:hypothetical protein
MSEQQKFDYPQWFILLLQDVLDMRDAQNDYFLYKTQSSMAVAKHKETVVDNKLSHFTRQGVIRHKTKPNNRQQELFK